MWETWPHFKILTQPTSGKRGRQTWYTRSSFAYTIISGELPIIFVTIDGYKRKAFVDSGYNRSMIRSSLASCRISPTKVYDFCGQSKLCMG
ncbi:hypothetical protein GJ496_007456 [Pomphorhynchus laevis]|nr:hypothetical protein GJ496_007456 [Pomphorhynchus laevis]